MTVNLKAQDILPRDRDAVLIGRAWSDAAGGPCPVLIDGDMVRDLSSVSATVAGLLNIEGWRPGPASAYPALGRLDDFLASPGDASKCGRLLAPNDLQVVKAAGVTFVDSMLERVIEERAKGTPELAERIRSELKQVIGDQLSAIVPGSDAARRAKEVLQAAGHWSQYLEVGIGPDAEIFTKASPLSSVGCGAMIGINPMSRWNNPEPEVVLAVNARGEIRGAALGNDVNLRDIEGRSALLLGKAKDNNGACAIGPFIRLLDDSFTIGAIERMEVRLSIGGPDGFKLNGTNDMSRISRSPDTLVRQTINASHQYPDGLMLFLGTMFAPVKDRAAPGQGFTHVIGDDVTIASDELGALVNRVGLSSEIEPWSFGILGLIDYLTRRQSPKV